MGHELEIAVVVGSLVVGGYNGVVMLGRMRRPMINGEEVEQIMDPSKKRDVVTKLKTPLRDRFVVTAVKVAGLMRGL